MAETPCSHRISRDKDNVLLPKELSLHHNIMKKAPLSFIIRNISNW